MSSQISGTINFMDKNFHETSPKSGSIIRLYEFSPNFYDHFLTRFMLHTVSRLGAIFGVSILEDKDQARNEFWDVVYHSLKKIMFFYQMLCWISDSESGQRLI